MRAAVYVRVSSAGQRDEGTSLQTQEAACRAYAAERGYDVAGVYSDVHTGSELWQRPRMSALRELVDRHELEVVIVYALDRLARKVAHQVIIAEQCERNGVELHCVTEPMDTSKEGQLISYVRGWAAELEREKIAERTIRGARQRLRDGKLPGTAFALYGYKRAHDKREIVDAQAVVVREIYRMALAGKGSNAIARSLNDRGIPAAKGGRWWEGQVRTLIANPAYKGESWAWRWQTTHKPKTQTKLRDRDGWIPLPAEVTPAIVTASLWEAVQDRMRVSAGETARNAKRQVLLRGHIECAICGMRCYADKDNGKTVYRCCSRHYADNGTCGASRVPADLVEAWAWEQLAVAWSDPAQIMREIISAEGEGDGHLRADRAAAAKKLQSTERGADRLLARYRESQDALSWRPFERQLALADNEAAALRTEIARLDAAIEHERRRADDLRSLPEICASIAERAANADFEARRDVLFALDVRVVASGLHWELSWSMPAGVPVATGRCYDDNARRSRLVRVHAGAMRVRPWGIASVR